MHTRRWASKRCFFFFNSNFLRLFASHSFCFPAACIAMQNKTPIIENRLIAHTFSPTISKHGANGRIRGRPGHHLFIESSFRRTCIFFICRGIFFLVPLFFIRFRIHMYNRYPESERVLVRFTKSLEGKTAKGYKRREIQRDTRERERE